MTSERFSDCWNAGWRFCWNQLQHISLDTFGSIQNYRTDHCGNCLFQFARFGFFSLYSQVNMLHRLGASPGCDFLKSPISANETYDTMRDPCHIVSELNSAAKCLDILLPLFWYFILWYHSFPHQNEYGLEPTSMISFWDERPFTSYC